MAHIFQLIGVFDRDEKLASIRIVNSVSFVFVRFATMVIGVLTLYYGVANTSSKFRAFFALLGLMVLQGYLIFSFITEQLRAKREAKREAKLQSQQPKKSKTPKDKVKRKKESDLPEADQSPSPVKSKVKWAKKEPSATWQKSAHQQQQGRIIRPTFINKKSSSNEFYSKKFINN